MQVLVMYYSRAGHTKKLAEAVAEGVAEEQGVKSVLKEAGEVSREDFLESAGIIAGSPVYFGTMAAELKVVFDKYVTLRKQTGDKIGAAFCTSGAEHGGAETTMMSIIQALMIYGMIIVGDPLDATGHYGVACAGTPEEKTMINAKKLGKRVAGLAKRIKA